MSAMEKSDLPEVARKRANNAASAAAEPVERRGGAKENAKLQSTVRTQSREAVSRAQARIREAVTRNRQDKLTALLHHVNIGVLRAGFFGLKKAAAPGVDERTCREATMAWPIDGAPTDESGGRRARQQDCTDGLGHHGPGREIQGAETVAGLMTQASS